MTTAVKAIAIGSTLATLIIPPSGYAIWAATRDNQITVKEWLEENGYAFNKPSHQEQEDSKGTCSENLFSDNKEESDLKSDQGLYACTVTKMDLYKTNSLANINPTLPKMKSFNYELAMKRGAEGWVINSKVDNSSDSGNTTVSYKLTHYTYSNNTWQKGNEMNLWNNPAVISGDPATQEIFSEGAVVEDVEIQDKKLIFKLSKNTRPKNSAEISEMESKSMEIERTGWTLIWFDLGLGLEFLMFDEIEIYLDGKKYSPEECKEGESKGCIKIPKETSSYSLTNEGRAMIQKIKGSYGIWLDIDSLCESKTSKELNESKKLIIDYCSNGKKIN